MHEAELEDRLAALMLRVDRHEDTTAADRRSLTRALADSVQREQAYSEQIAHLRKLVEQLDLGMKMERESRLRADARAMALERRVEELERRQHTSASRVMPPSPPVLALPRAPPLHSLPCAESVRQYIEQRAHEAYVQHETQQHETQHQAYVQHQAHVQHAWGSEVAIRASAVFAPPPPPLTTAIPPMAQGNFKRTRANLNVARQVAEWPALSTPAPSAAARSDATISEATDDDRHATNSVRPATPSARSVVPSQDGPTATSMDEEGFRILLEAEDRRRSE